MMSLRLLSLLIVGSCLTALKTSSAADVLVQLNVNRPFNDVNEKFVNFAIKPEELYRALDGDNRRVITRMAAMLGESYIKFTNDYEFAMNSEMKLRNPTKIIWKGFNRWARAVNWTMVIPLPYDPETWDPMETLRILNSSYLTGISDCVWQLGTDFGASHAEDYVAELGTLNMMVESFKAYVEDWRIMGADISAGSSAEETRRYIKMSRDLNAAFGWTQASQASNPLATISNDNDPALRVLLREKVPVWLTLPQKAKLKTSQQVGNVIVSDEATEGLNWAKTLGEAASTGYDAVFKRITATDLERPSFSYYVSALFKKVMGSRVFPARPLNMFHKTNKLYTHCANTVTGGIAFMIVNTNEQALQLQIHSLSKMATTEVWQYTLTMKKSATLLNNERLWYNTTLRPQKSQKQSTRTMQLSTPGRSVSFWVLPDVNIDHCQYTEVVADELNEKDSSEQPTQKRYTSSDKLLKKLIQETSLANNPLARVMNRHRRYASRGGRAKRFILKDKGTKPSEQGWSTLFRPFADMKNDEAAAEPDLKVLAKREHILKPAAPLNPFSWLTDLMENTMTRDFPLLKRAPRSIDDDYFGPLFATKDGKTTTAFTKKITEIKKPEENIKPLFDMDEFDEEEFFKKLENYREPEHPRFPNGDVMLELITSPDGEEIDENGEERIKTGKPQSGEQSQEVVSEMKPLRLLPTELYESLPLKPFKPAAKNFPSTIGGALNTLFFPEPFTKKPSKTKKVLSTEKDIKPIKGAATSISQMTRDFIRAQQELSRTFGEEPEKSNESVSKKVEEAEEITEKSTTKSTSESPTTKASSLEAEDVKAPKGLPDFPMHDYLPDHIENFFGESDNEARDIDLNNKDGVGKQKFDELPWWDLDLLKQKRTRRALYFQIPDDDLHNNLISKDEELIPLGARILPEQLGVNEIRVPVNSQKKQEEVTEKKPTEHKFVTTFKEKVSNLVDIVARQVNDWYDTFTKHIESGVGSGKKVDNSTKTAGNGVN